MPGVIQDVGISQIEYSAKSRRIDEFALSDLVNSIREKGLLQPIVVRPKDGYFEIVAGNRRCKACTMLKWRKIACHIVELDDKAAFECALVENIQRETLSIIEEAESFKTYVNAFGWGGVSELAKKIGKSPSYITKKIKLLEMPTEVINSVVDSSLDASVAEELCSVKDPLKQSELAKLVTQRHLSLRKTRELVNRYRENNDTRDNVLEKRQKALDKMILIMRITLNNAGQLIEDYEDDWVLRDALMQHKTVLHNQIDLLIKERHKLRYPSLSR